MLKSFHENVIFYYKLSQCRFKTLIQSKVDITTSILLLMFKNTIYASVRNAFVFQDIKCNRRRERCRMFPTETPGLNMPRCVRKFTQLGHSNQKSNLYCHQNNCIQWSLRWKTTLLWSQGGLSWGFGLILWCKMC